MVVQQCQVTRFLLLALPRFLFNPMLLLPREFEFATQGCAVLPVSLPVDLLYPVFDLLSCFVPHPEFVVFSRVVVLCLLFLPVMVVVSWSLLWIARYLFVDVRGRRSLVTCLQNWRFCPHQ